MELRPYQRQAIDATYDHLRTRSDNPCIVIPVGGGKTIVMAELIREALTQWPGTRICVVAHVQELVSQNADKLAKHWPEAPIGIYSASLNRRDRFEPVIFASIQSVYKKAQMLGRFDLLLVDEAHRIPLGSEGTYRQFINECKKANPDLRIIGLTATPYRLGTGHVCGEDFILNEVCYEAKIADLIRDGYLSPLVSKGGVARADLTGVHVRGGEYVASELSAAVNRFDLVERACDEIMTLCQDRTSWIIFCASVEHAETVCNALAKRGVAIATVEANTPKAQRAATIEAFQRGELRALCNVNVLCEGFDCPRVDAVIMLRPTKSAGLYVQQVGRGTRLHPGKNNCLVLDFAGNIAEHGPVDSIKVRKPRKPGDKTEVKGAPVKECPRCHEIVTIQTMACPCGYTWTRAFAGHDVTATDAAILSADQKPVTHLVLAVTYKSHEKPGKPPSLCVSYHCGLNVTRRFREWICLEHSGLPRVKALSWWRSRASSATVPATVEQALERTKELAVPTRIHVKELSKFPEIVGYDFN